MDTYSHNRLPGLLLLSTLTLVSCTLVSCTGPPPPIPLIAQPIVLTPGDGAEWKTTVELLPGSHVFEITYGSGGIVNEGYPGFPPTPYSPYKEGRGCDRMSLSLDGALIVQAVLPPMPPEAHLLRQAAIPFVCETSGFHELKVVATLHSDEQRLEIQKATVTPSRPRRVPHTLTQPRPVRPLIDAISWNEYVFYTIPPGLGPDDILAKTLRPSWKAGFNLIWTVLNGPSGSVPFPWDEKAIGIPAPESFPWNEDKRWQVEGYRRYLGHVRDRNMMEMLYWPGGSPVPKEMQEIALPGKKASSIRFFDTIYNSLDYAHERLSDGISNERYCATDNSLKGSRELAVAHVNQILESNPGALAVNYISGVDSARPGMIGDMPNGLEPYSSGYFQGFEDSLMFSPDPWLLRVDGGKKYRWIEFWTEDGEIVPKEDRATAASAWWRQQSDVPDSFFGGHIGEDYIVKQMNDVARLRLLDPDSFDALTGVTWYTDGQFVSEANVEMAHAVSQDPVRGALAGRLRTLGQGGRVRSLYPYPTGSHFLQNNYLALYFPEGKPHGELFYDFERSGHFTPFSHRVALVRDFLRDPDRTIDSPVVSRILERGAYRAVIRREVEVGSGDATLKQRRTYTMIADTPYFTVTIDEEAGGQKRPLVNTLSSAGFDSLRVDENVVKEAGSVPLPRVAILSDTIGLKPDTAFLFLDAPRGSTLEWKPNESLSVSRPVAEPLRVAVVVPTDLYMLAELRALATSLSQRDPVLEWEDGPMEVSNVAGLPLTRSVTLRGVDDRPYLVKEGGWWTFRGAQVSKVEEGSDILKLYLRSGEKATILPWGFIEGAVRPGWGCQYVLAIGGVQATSDGAACRVKVVNETPMVFAPRVEFAFPIAEASLNGEPWHYFEGRNVFLPQPRGEYRVRVEKQEENEEAAAPHVSRTYLNVRSTKFADDVLTIDTSAPPWRPKIPEGVRMTAQIEHEGRTLTEVSGGQVVRQAPGKSIVQIAPGISRLQFESRGSSH